jgi:hypothetical protein
MCGCSKKQIEPAPTTTVQGTVTDASTGKPVANLQLQLQSELFFSYYFDQNLKTDANGTFYLRYTPKGDNPKLLILFEPPEDYYVVGNNKQPVTAGQSNSYNILTYKLVNVTIHLTNNSTQNEKYFRMLVNNGQFGTFFEFPNPNIKIDTLLHTKLAQLSTFTIQSIFYNGYNSAGYYTDSVIFKKNVNIGTADTTVSVVNP